MIALISSVSEEGTLLLGELKKSKDHKSLRVYRGAMSGKDVIYAVSGMGKTNAAHAATIMIEKFSPEIMILFGVGGAYPSTGLKVGDIAIAEKEIYGDEGALVPGGFRGTEFMGIPFLKKGEKKYFNEFVFDKKLAGKARESFKSALCSMPYAPKAMSGSFVTVSTCTGTRKRAREMRKRFNALCENMEGSSVAHICAIYNIPMIEIRGISNIVEDRDNSKWNIKLASENCQKVVMGLLKNL